MPHVLPKLKSESKPLFPRTAGRKWMAIRRRQLEREPLCRHCSIRRKVVAAEEVDHIVPVSRGGMDWETNLQSLCIPCHRIKSEADQRGMYQVI